MPKVRSRPCETGPEEERGFVTECIQRPLEILYLPDQYHHETCLLGDGAANYSIGVAYIDSFETELPLVQASFLGDADGVADDVRRRGRGTDRGGADRPTVRGATVHRAVLAVDCADEPDDVRGADERNVDRADGGPFATCRHT